MSHRNRTQKVRQAGNRTNAIRSLMLIDDSRLRKESFAQADKIIKKIDRLEDNITSFYESDQRLFNDWFELTFRDERQTTATMQGELRELARFHNWVIAVARQLDISMPEAFRIVKDEANQYARGDEQVRQKIDAARAARDRFIQEEMEREFREQYEDESDDDDFLFEDEEEERSGPPRSPDEERIFERLCGMSDKKIHQTCRSHEGAFELLSLAMELSRTPLELKLFLKIWDLTPQKHQNTFAKMFAQAEGVSLQAAIKEMRAMIAAIESMAEEPFGGPDSDTADEQSDEDIWEEFLASGTHPSARQASSPEQEERLKLIYRKLVRRLHPDLQDPEANAREVRWQKKIWDRAQQAHKNRRIDEIERLYKLTLLRQKELTELTIGEIRESSQWLSEELSRLQREADGMKRLPAWGFSRAKSHQTVAKKIKKDFDREQHDLAERIDDMKDQQEMLEVLSQISNPTRRKRSKGKRGSTRTRADKGQKSKSSKQRQMSMFD